MIACGNRIFVGVVSTCFVLLGGPSDLLGQQVNRCPAPTADVDTIIRRIERIGAGQTTFGRNSPRSAIGDMVSIPFAAGVCPTFRPDVDRRAALVRLLRYAMNHADDKIAGPVMEFGIANAFRVANPGNWTPTELLFDVVQTGRNRAARWQALLRLVESATDPSIRGRLLALLRSSAGPAVWPDLPSDLLASLYYMPSPAARLLDAELLAFPGQLRNPLSKWMIECGRGHPVPRRPSDACHPENAPRRIAGSQLN